MRTFSDRLGTGAAFALTHGARNVLLSHPNLGSHPRVVEVLRPFSLALLLSRPLPSSEARYLLVAGLLAARGPPTLSPGSQPLREVPASAANGRVSKLQDMASTVAACIALVSRFHHTRF
jgi:hypothetical protein